MRLFYLLHSLLFVSAFFGNPVTAAEEETIDFSDMITPVCVVVGLTAVPPPGLVQRPHK